MKVNPSWNYKDLVKNIRTLKISYWECLTSFSNILEENQYIYETRKNIYVLNIEEFQKDRVWEYMNGDLTSIDVFMLFGFLEKED